MGSLLSILDLADDEICEIFDLASFYLKNGIKNSLAHKVVFSLFFESSTRTETSFSLAATKLGCHVEKINTSTLADKKGETITDVISTLDALSPDLFIIRHGESGVLSSFAKYVNCPIINAGDGMNEHPTQALIDAFTILLLNERLEDIHVLICGDIIRSRVAHSLILLLRKLGSIVSITGPRRFIPNFLEGDIQYYHSMDEALKDADVIFMLRQQDERSAQRFSVSENKNYSLTHLRMINYAKPDSIIMHPGPVNRGREIENSVLDDPRNVILKQVQMSQYIRAAVINFLLQE